MVMAVPEAEGTLAGAVQARKQRAQARRPKVVTQTHTPTAGGGYQRSTVTTPPKTPTRPRGKGSSFEIKSLDGPHTGALFAEYFAAAVVISLALFTETATQGYSATISKVMIRLTALTSVFFVLFLLQGSKRGAQAAIWFGLLIDVGVVFTAARGNLFTTVATEVSGTGLSSQGITLDSAGNLDNGGGGIKPPVTPAGVTLPDE